MSSTVYTEFYSTSVETSAVPSNQLSSIIICLTIRKTLNIRWDYYIKYSFGLLRGLYKESTRQTTTKNKKPHISRIKSSDKLTKRLIYNENEMPAYNKTFKALNISKKRIPLGIKSQRLERTFIRTSKSIHKLSCIFIKKLSNSFQKLKIKTQKYFETPKKFLNVVNKVIRKSLGRVFEITKRNYRSFAEFRRALQKNTVEVQADTFEKILTVGVYEKYVKINSIYTRCSLYKLAAAFVYYLFRNWETKVAEICFSVNYLNNKDKSHSSYALGVLLPLPVSIHDYIDDFYSISKENIDASYFSLTSTEDFTTRLTPELIT